MRRGLYPLVLAAALAVVASFCVVVLDEREQAFRTFLQEADYQIAGLRLGESILTEPGWYLRIPGLHQLYRYDRRQLLYHADPKDLYTLEKELIQVDYFALWRIEDPRLFYESVRGSYEAATARIDDITFNEVREVMGRSPLRALLSAKRQDLMQQIASASDKAMREYGIRIDDLRIRRTDYPAANLERIFERMRTERERFAKRFRAEGEEEARTIRSQADRDSDILRAEALRQSEKIRGEGDAEATRVYAEAYGADPEFYAFVRTLKTYELSLKDDTTMILSPASPFLRYLFTDGAPDLTR